MKIRPLKPRPIEIVVPGSKSYSHRILIASALSNGVCTIENCLNSDDTRYTMEGLKQMGVAISEAGTAVIVHGCSGGLAPCNRPLFLGNSGTSMRLLTAVAGLGKGGYTLLGSERMHARPIADLLDGLNQLGISADSVRRNGCPPVAVRGGSGSGGAVALRCAKSSQFLSAILLIAPFLRRGADIRVVEGPVSRPYIDMTLAVMEQFGVSIDREGDRLFKVAPAGPYQAVDCTVEPDASQAGYFWAAAAVTGADIKVKGIGRDSIQGDVRLVSLLESMGCRVIQESDGIRVLGGPLKAIEADMADIPDMVPTLAVVAAFAEGTTAIKNVAHLKEKESNRLEAVARELRKMGVEAACTPSGLTVRGGRPQGARIETYLDHRIAMSFAVAGLVVPEVEIQDPLCVAKSFPGFWDVFEGLYA